mmetsp:Transcript_15573/g.30642  ORF Transcript_15573/g.30642 Transcript_15573/m.30642 type:complete len:138 (+) Transcript_15573:242-655(+)
MLQKLQAEQCIAGHIPRAEHMAQRCGNLRGNTAVMTARKCCRHLCLQQKREELSEQLAIQITRAVVRAIQHLEKRLPQLSKQSGFEAFAIPSSSRSFIDQSDTFKLPLVMAVPSVLMSSSVLPLRHGTFHGILCLMC